MSNELTLREMAEKVRAAGRGGDIHLIHVNEDELAIIRETLGFDGSINEDTGLVAFWDEEDPNPNAVNKYASIANISNEQARQHLISNDMVRSDGNLRSGWGDSAANMAASNMQASSMEAYKSLMLESTALSGEMGIEALEKSYELGIRASERTEAKMPEWASQATASATSEVSKLNQFMEGQFYGALDRLYPEWREQIVEASATAQGDMISLTEQFKTNIMPNVLKAADEMGIQAISNAQSLLRGELPDDVAAQIRRTSAEVAQQIGSRGQAAQYLTARDLGLTSLDLQQQGLANAPAALGLAPQAYGIVGNLLQQPMQSAANMTNLLAPYRAPQGDVFGMQQNILGQLSGHGAISANTAFQTGAQVQTQFANMGMQSAQFATELGSQSYWNSINAGLQSKAISEAGKSDPFSQAMTGIGALGQAAGGIGMAAIAFSDRRLKRNVSKIGQVRGINVYEWDYVWGEHSRGVMADEVPWAIGGFVNGFAFVDYMKVWA